MVSQPAVLVVVVALVALLVLAIRWAWRDRRVDFIHSLVLGPEADAVAATLFDGIVPVLATDGYVMVAHAGHTTVFERRFFPGWTILVAILFFPVGLLALLARGRESIVVVSQDDVLDVHGYCRKLEADFVIAVADDAAAHYTPAA